jgi:hypothetical protein
MSNIFNFCCLKIERYIHLASSNTYTIVNTMVSISPSPSSPEAKPETKTESNTESTTESKPEPRKVLESDLFDTVPGKKHKSKAKKNVVIPKNQVEYGPKKFIKP